MGRLRTWSWVAFGASIGAVAAAFLPWVKVLFLTASGTDGGDGWLTAGAGALGATIAALIATGTVDKTLHVVTLLCAVAIAGIGLWDMDQVRDGNQRADGLTADAGIEAQVGEGLYLTVAAGVTLAVASVVSMASPRPPRAALPVPVHAPGWYPDPYGVARWRWWDGAQWTVEARS